MTFATHTLIADSNHAGGIRILSTLTGATVRRAAIAATVIGSVLTAINQPAALFGPEEIRLLPLTLVYLTPFITVLLSQMLAIRRARADTRAAGGQARFEESPMVTAAGHGIPARAFLVGIAVASVNTAIVLGNLALTGDGASALPVVPLAQAWVLPIVFGIASQAIAYRRVRG